MDQIKIGGFIAQCRKNVGLTQMQLAERLSVTDRAVSKWENGRAMPDSSIMLDLCEQLNITVNDLLCGEVVSMENYNKELEKNLIEMTRAKEDADKRLLRVEIVVGLVCVFVLFSFTMIASLLTMQEWLRIVLIFAGMLPLLIATPFMLKIEQVAGYYKCGNCGHCYIPSYKAINMAPHYGRTRKMRCPECGKKTWQKKVISKE